MRHQGQFEDKLFGSSDMIWDAFAYKRAGIARLQGEERSQRLAARTADEVEEGRQRILDVAERLIRRLGHPKTTMATIAWELGTSRSTIYRHFPSKEALEEQVCRRIVSRMVRQVRDALTEKQQAFDQLTTLLTDLGRQTFSRMALEPHLHHLFVEAFRNRWHVATEYLREVRDLIEGVVLKGQAEKTFVPGDGNKIMTFIMGAMLVFVNPGLTELLSFDDSELSVDLAAHVKSVVSSIAREKL